METLTLRQRIKTYKEQTGYDDMSNDAKKQLAENLIESLTAFEEYNNKYLLKTYLRIRKGD